MFSKFFINRPIFATVLALLIVVAGQMCIRDRYKKAEVIKALLSVHPYEEPAFDIYPLLNDWSQAGSGIVGELDESETELEFLKRIINLLARLRVAINAQRYKAR